MKILWRLLAALARVPFTTALEVAILAIALANGSAVGGLSAVISRDWGFDPFHFWEGRWHSLATGTVLVRNFAMLAGIVAFLIASVGVYERRLGTVRAVALFFLAHLTTLILTTALVVYPLHLAGARVELDWAPAGDVGASFGAFGCMGGWIRRTSPRARLRWLGIVTLALAAKLLIYPERFGDMGHLIALYAGILLDRLLPEHASSSKP